MNIIKTTSFQLAINSQGHSNSTKLALVLPGRLDTKDYACFNSHISYLSSLGFEAISFDAPGTWESPGGIELFTTTNYIKAVNELIEYFGNKPTFLMGHSRGATVSVLAGSNNQHVIAFAPIMATFSSEPSPIDMKTIESGVKMSYRDIPPGTSKTTEQKEFALPLNYFTDMRNYNVVSEITNSTKPKLIFYGEDDEFTKPEVVENMYSSLLEPKMIHELKVNHDYRYHPEIIKEINDTVGMFLKKFNLL